MRSCGEVEELIDSRRSAILYIFVEKLRRNGDCEKGSDFKTSFFLDMVGGFFLLMLPFLSRLPGLSGKPTTSRSHSFMILGINPTPTCGTYSSFLAWYK